MIDLTEYKNKNAGDEIKASEWNELLSKIEEGSNINVPVTDVLVNGESVVTTDGIAKIDLKEDVSEELEFYVNGELQTVPEDGVIKLAAEGTYVLKGELNGQILISATADVASDTFLILDGVTIKTDSGENYGIMYAPDAETLHVILPVNTSNYISCTHEAAMVSEQKAALYSEKNLIVQGNGMLTVLNKGGHGIKASELRIMGNPTIVAEANHDAIHGNSALDIYGGTFKVTGANDAFGTGETGSINVFGGSFEANNVLQNVFDSKVAGFFYTKVPIVTSLASIDGVINNMTDVDPSTKFGVGTVTCYSDSDMTLDETAITAVDGVYSLSTAYAKVTGYVEGTIAATLQSTDVSLNSAYIKGSITYPLEKKKLQITAEKETVNFIVGTNTAINSTKNVAIEVKSKSYLEIQSAEGSGLVGVDVTINDSKGVLVIQNCGKYGIDGKTIYIGTDADNKGQTFDGALVVSGNKICDICATLRADKTDTVEGGTISILDSGLHGTVTVGSIDVKQYIDLNSSKKVAYNSITGIVIGNPIK